MEFYQEVLLPGHNLDDEIQDLRPDLKHWWDEMFKGPGQGVNVFYMWEEWKSLRYRGDTTRFQWIMPSIIYDLNKHSLM